MGSFHPFQNDGTNARWCLRKYFFQATLLGFCSGCRMKHTLTSVISCVQEVFFKMTFALSPLQAMIRGELEVLRDWCYEAVRLWLWAQSTDTRIPEASFVKIGYVKAAVRLPSEHTGGHTAGMMFSSFSPRWVCRRTASWHTPFSKPRPWDFISTLRSWTLTTLM